MARASKGEFLFGFNVVVRPAPRETRPAPPDGHTPRDSNGQRDFRPVGTGTGDKVADLEWGAKKTEPGHSA